MTCDDNSPKKTEKTHFKASNIFARTPVFLPKRPKKGPFFLSVLSMFVPFAFLVIAADGFALISEIAFFEPKSAV